MAYKLRPDELLGGDLALSKNVDPMNTFKRFWHWINFFHRYYCNHRIWLLDGGMSLYAEHSMASIGDRLNVQTRGTKIVVFGSSGIRTRIHENKVSLAKAIAAVETRGKVGVLDSDQPLILKVKTSMRIVYLVVICETGLNLLSAMVLIAEPGIQWTALRLMLALVVTVGATIAWDKWIEAFFPQLKYHEDPKGHLEDPHEVKAPPRQRKIFFSIVVSVISLVVSVFAFKRASEFEVGEQGWTVVGVIVTVGMVLLALVLPILAGYIYAVEVSPYNSIIRSTAEVKKERAKRTRLELALQKDKEGLKMYFEALKNEAWARFLQFRDCKELRNQDMGITEDMNKHFAHDWNSFEAEADRRYKDKIVFE